MLDPQKIPRHIAIIMDGNGRWAEKRGLPRIAGHNAGVLAMKEIVKRCSTLNVAHLTVYVFSTENWRRSADEVSGIFDLVVHYVDQELAELHANNVRVSLVGDLTGLPEDAAERIHRSIDTTKDNDGLGFHLAINYGGRAEIVRAVRRLAGQIKAGELIAEAIDEETIADHLYTAGLPDPDLLIRPGGEYRLSNFLLWQSAYSEFVFTDTLWPDFTPEHLEEAIELYQRRARRFGGR
ncbi:MAG TPA: isoprenyl transferase [Clostridiales bacterium]|jgi:undecaprenyl diphosphate synthase|nr:isoprenyl transferase [Clostridiales bacterium]